MFTHRTQKTLLAGTSLLAAGMLLSACGPGDDSSAGKSNSGASSSSSAPSSSSSSSGSSDSSNSSGSSDSGSTQTDAASGKTAGKVSRTVSGQIKYLAPGKFTVDAGGKTLAFFIEQGAKIEGWGTICGEPNERTSCTERQLESSTKTKKVMATVALEKGVATSVSENKPGTAGGDAE